MAQLLYTNQYYTTTLNVGGGIDASQTTGIIIAGVSGLDITKPGIALINYADPLVTSTCEWVEYTSIDGSNELQGVTRGAEGFSAKTHANGVSVAFPLSESHINRLALKLDGVESITNDFSLPATGNIQVALADPKRTMYVPATAMFPSTTAPCASIAQVESTTNDVNIKVLDFDGAGTSKEYAEFGIQSPSFWDASTVTVQFVWYATAGSGTVNWEIQGLALSDDDALDTAYGTLQEVTDTLTATGDVHITAETSALTIAGTPVAGDWLQFKVARDPANDTNTSDARLMGIRIRFGIAKYQDA